MSTHSLHTFFSKWQGWITVGIIIVLFFALLASLSMMSDALQNSAHFENLYTVLLAVNVVAALALLILIAFHVKRLISQVRRRRMGAQLTVRILSLFVVLSLIPATIVYLFSLEFLHRQLNSWFTFEVESALDSSLELSKAALDNLLKEAYRRTETAAEEIEPFGKKIEGTLLDNLREQTGAQELTLFTNNGKLLLSSVSETNLLPSRPNENVLLQLRNSYSYVSLEPMVEQGLNIRVVLKIDSVNQHEKLLLHALFPVPKRLTELAEKVQKSYRNYGSSKYLHAPLKLSFTLVLSLVLLLSLFAAIWMAFFSAQRLVAPLSNLAEGTRAVARGDYDKQLPVTHQDELGFLVQSFNDMTRRIARARDDVKRQQIYLEAILERLSSGVISFDAGKHLLTVNPAASNVLGVNLQELLGKTLTELHKEHSDLQSFYLLIEKHLHESDSDWREETTIFGSGGRKVLMCRGTRLPMIEEQQGGYVLVFDDVTTLIQAQRDAAWSEVARRLAHEIKNPLMPIQLAAERLRHKYLKKMTEEDAETLDRLTYTIIQQVDAMKEMVNAFSEYAKTPTIKKQPLNLNDLVREMSYLYQQQTVHFRLSLVEDLPLIEADRGRLRQILHNLIKNAIEAGQEAGQEDIFIDIATRHLIEPNLNCVEFCIRDQGAGVPTQLLEKLFEPYVTSKTKGSGLGLAIVKKIVDEHGGIIWVENNGGASFNIRLPAITSTFAIPIEPISI